MAPEQLEGREADARSDIFAFGCLLYEMLTGNRAFDGKSHAAIAAQILSAEPPPLRQLQPHTPPALESLLQSCLAKDREERWQTARDLRRAISLIQLQPADSKVDITGQKIRLAGTNLPLPRWIGRRMAGISEPNAGVANRAALQSTLLLKQRSSHSPV